MIIVITGVSGSGKTVVGRQLAADLGWKFYDGDDLHPPANVQRMASGIPLTDEDREPWLERLARLIGEIDGRGESAVLACSALRHAYRRMLRQASGDLRFVFLEGDPALIAERLRGRAGHFFDPHLLASQFRTLEKPHDAVTVGASPPVNVIAAEIRKRLGL